MFINLSNHLSARWSAEQTEAAWPVRLLALLADASDKAVTQNTESRLVRFHQNLVLRSLTY